MSLEKRPGSPYWQIVIHHQGERIRRSSGTADRKEAQRIHDRIKAELWSAPRCGVERTWLDACTEWLTAAERSESDRYSLRALNAAYRDRPLSQCSPDSFVEALADKKTPGTFNRYRAIIVAILNMADIKLKLPARKTKKGRLRFLSHDEWQRLHAALPDHLKPIAAFALATGLRQRNVTHLQWSEIDLRRAVLWVHPDMTKAGKPIGVPISDEAMAILHAQAGKHDACPPCAGIPCRIRQQREAVDGTTKKNRLTMGGFLCGSFCGVTARFVVFCGGFSWRFLFLR